MVVRFRVRGTTLAQNEVASVRVLQVPEKSLFRLDPVVANAIRHLLEEK
jgi:hypothetical protein